jgi:hypothetical protein
VRHWNARNDYPFVNRSVFMHILDIHLLHIHISTCYFFHIIRVLNSCGGKEGQIPQLREAGECNYEATNVLFILIL